MYTLLYLTVSRVLSLSLSSKKVAFGNNQDVQFKKNQNYFSFMVEPDKHGLTLCFNNLSRSLKLDSLKL